MTTLTAPAVAEAIDQIIIERGPGFVYAQGADGGCYYSTVTGEPGCFVGAVVAKLDPEAFQQLVDAETASDDGAGGQERNPVGAVNYIIHQGFIAVESSALRSALCELQDAQDAGATYALARDLFIRTLRSFSDE